MTNIKYTRSFEFIGFILIVLMMTFIFGILYIFYELELSSEQFFLDIHHALSCSHHHFHHEEGILFILAQIKLFPCTSSQNIFPWLTLIIIPIKFSSKFVHLTVETQYFDIWESSLLQKQMLNWLGEYLLNDFSL